MTGDAIHDVGGIGEWLEIHVERRPRDASVFAAFCEGKLAHFKVPRRIAVVDALPRNATGKRLKHELPRQYGAASATAKG